MIGFIIHLYFALALFRAGYVFHEHRKHDKTDLSILLDSLVYGFYSPIFFLYLKIKKLFK